MTDFNFDYLNVNGVNGGMAMIHGFRYRNALAQDTILNPGDNAGAGEDLTGTQQYKNDVDQYGNATDQYNYYTSDLYRQYLIQTQKMDATQAAIQAAETANNVRLADLQNQLDIALRAAREKDVPNPNFPNLINGDYFIIMGIKVPKLAVYIIGAGAAFLLVKRFLFLKK